MSGVEGVVIVFVSVCICLCCFFIPMNIEEIRVKRREQRIKNHPCYKSYMEIHEELQNHCIHKRKDEFRKVHIELHRLQDEADHLKSQNRYTYDLYLEIFEKEKEYEQLYAQIKYWEKDVEVLQKLYKKYIETFKF